MTIFWAEKICGYRIERLSPIGAKVAEFAAYDDESKMLATAYSEQGENVALKMLVEALYDIEGDKIYAEQGGRCLDCGRPLVRKSMERHHIVPRSRGRRDRGNLAGLCGGCHRKRHRESKL